jgi:hypothetical protein
MQVKAALRKPLANVRAAPVGCVRNVFVGACLGTGAASRVIAACLSGLHVPLMGAALLSEYEDVLGRGALSSQCRLSSQEREELLDIYLAHCRWTRIYFG